MVFLKQIVDTPMFSRLFSGYCCLIHILVIKAGQRGLQYAYISDIDFDKSSHDLVLVWVLEHNVFLSILNLNLCIAHVKLKLQKLFLLKFVVYFVKIKQSHVCLSASVASMLYKNLRS